MALSISILPADMFFLRGGQAETAGRALATRLAAAGEDVELEVVLRDGTLAGRIAFPAALAA